MKTIYVPKILHDTYCDKANEMSAGVLLVNLALVSLAYDQNSTQVKFTPEELHKRIQEIKNDEYTITVVDNKEAEDFEWNICGI